ncbi:CGNR zinc finger domain-containing protein [Embleya scabrispora]|uniref:CGNR zinc finger domain-containing protein n=1 Tax=Embleya scabrispora TaxID=159449 RepID=UPI001F17C0F9|nr:CGNR zinc finger domain-containing protein [Embleya scabrispora]
MISTRRTLAGALPRRRRLLRLGLCGAPRCDRAYVDTSRNAGRQFCSTACQNRVKAAAFRARHTNDPT